MNTNLKSILTIMIAAVAVAAVTLPASADSSKKPKPFASSASSPSAATAAAATGGMPESVPAREAGHEDHKPGPAWKTIGGTVKQIKGNQYTVEDYEGNQVQLHVGRDTKHLRGAKKVGDRVRAEITHGGFANSIQ
jgi:hypothetical protein